MISVFQILTCSFFSEQEATHRAFRVACGIHLGPKKREVGELYALFRHTSKLFLGKSCEVF
jgi:hypothetical protein